METWFRTKSYWSIVSTLLGVWLIYSFGAIILDSTWDRNSFGLLELIWFGPFEVLLFTIGNATWFFCVLLLFSRIIHFRGKDKKGWIVMISVLLYVVLFYFLLFISVVGGWV